MRRDWLHQSVTRIQLLGATVPFAQRGEARDLLTELASSLPEPVSPIERQLLRGLLIELACRLTAEVVQRTPVARRTDSRRMASTHFERFWDPELVDPRTAFRQWTVLFFDELSKLHPPSCATRAAALVQQDRSRWWSVEGLATRLGVRPSRLRRQFRQEFGCSVREFQQYLRVREALVRVCEDKIEAVALLVGYRSKKFFKAFKRLVGMTPSQFRRLPREEIAEVRNRLETSFMRRGKATGGTLRV